MSTKNYDHKKNEENENAGQTLDDQSMHDETVPIVHDAPAAPPGGQPTTPDKTPEIAAIAEDAAIADQMEGVPAKPAERPIATKSPATFKSATLPTTRKEAPIPIERSGARDVSEAQVPASPTASYITINAGETPGIAAALRDIERHSPHELALALVALKATIADKDAQIELLSAKAAPVRLSATAGPSPIMLAEISKKVIRSMSVRDEDFAPNMKTFLGEYLFEAFVDDDTRLTHVEQQDTMGWVRMLLNTEVPDSRSYSTLHGLFLELQRKHGCTLYKSPFMLTRECESGLAALQSECDRIKLKDKTTRDALVPPEVAVEIMHHFERCGVKGLDLNALLIKLCRCTNYDKACMTHERKDFLKYVKEERGTDAVQMLDKALDDERKIVEHERCGPVERSAWWRFFETEEKSKAAKSSKPVVTAAVISPESIIAALQARVADLESHARAPAAVVSKQPIYCDRCEHDTHDACICWSTLTDAQKLRIKNAPTTPGAICERCGRANHVKGDCPVEDDVIPRIVKARSEWEVRAAQRRSRLARPSKSVPRFQSVPAARKSGKATAKIPEAKPVMQTDTETRQARQQTMMMAIVASLLKQIDALTNPLAQSSDKTEPEDVLGNLAKAGAALKAACGLPENSAMARASTMPAKADPPPLPAPVRVPTADGTSRVLVNYTLAALEKAGAAFTVYDTGSSKHTCCRRDAFVELHPCNYFVQFADSTVRQSCSEGVVKIILSDGSIDFLSGVLYIPGGHFNILSVEQMVSLGWTKAMVEDRYVLKSPNGEHTISSFKHTENEILAADIVFAADRHAAAYLSAVWDVQFRDLSRAEKVRVLHNRYSHQAHGDLFETIRRLHPELQAMHKDFEFCEDCVKCKTPRRTVKHLHRQIHATKPFEEVHVDSFFFKNSPGLRGEIGGVIFVDEFTKIPDIILFKKQSEVTAIVEGYLKDLEQIYGVHVCKLCSDCGSEFTKKALQNFFQEHGTQWWHSCPYRHHQNGVAERHIGVMKGSVRAMLEHARLPARFWSEAAIYWSMVKARTFCRVIGSTPMAKWLGAESSMEHFLTFGCDIMVENPRDLGHSNPRSGPFVYMHPLVGASGVLYFNQETETLHDTTMVTPINESSFHTTRSPLTDEDRLAAPEPDDPEFIMKRKPGEVWRDPVENTFEWKSKPGKWPRGADAERNGAVPTQPQVEGRVTRSKARAAVITAEAERVKAQKSAFEGALLAELPSSSTVASHFIFLANATVAARWPNKQTEKEAVEAKPKPEKQKKVRKEWRSKKEGGAEPTRTAQNAEAEPDEPRAVTEPDADVDVPGLEREEELREFLAGKTYEAHVKADAVVLSILKSDGSKLKIGEVFIPLHAGQVHSNHHAAYWLEAEQREFSDLADKQAFEEVRESAADLQRTGKIIVPTKLVYALKSIQEDVERFKARLVACGNVLKKGQGYDADKLDAPTLPQNILRTLLGLAAKNHMFVSTGDFSAAYINAPMTEGSDYYIKVPVGYKTKSPNTTMLKVMKALYGFPQSAMCWYKHVSTKLKAGGFESWTGCKCLFKAKHEGELVLIGLYVDDVIIAAESRRARDWAISVLRTAVTKPEDFKDLGPITKFLGLDVTYNQDEGIVSIDNTAYVKRFLTFMSTVARTGLRTTLSPVEVNQARVPVRNEDIDRPDVESSRHDDYAKAIGMLGYMAARWRPDLAHAVCFLSRFTTARNSEVELELKRVTRYIAGTVDFSITLDGKTMGPTVLKKGKNDETTKFDFMHAYTDAAHPAQKDLKDKRAVSGYIILMGLSPIMWQSFLQKRLCCATAVAEWIAAHLCAGEIEYLRMALMFMGFEFTMPTPMQCDNHGVIHCSSGHDPRAKEMRNACIEAHRVIEMEENGTLKLWPVHVSEGELNMADVFTKAQEPCNFEAAVKLFMTGKRHKYVGKVNLTEQSDKEKRAEREKRNEGEEERADTEGTAESENRSAHDSECTCPSEVRSARDESSKVQRMQMVCAAAARSLESAKEEMKKICAAAVRSLANTKPLVQDWAVLFGETTAESAGVRGKGEKTDTVRRTDGKKQSSRTGESKATDVKAIRTRTSPVAARGDYSSRSFSAPSTSSRVLVPAPARNQVSRE